MQIGYRHFFSFFFFLLYILRSQTAKYNLKTLLCIRTGILAFLVTRNGLNEEGDRDLVHVIKITHNNTRIKET